MSALRNHPGFWMRDDAEASLARWEADHGIIGVNSAGRTVAEQQRLIDRWDQGGKYNRPPYLYGPKRPASASAHVANGGVAFDTSEYERFRRTSADYGWWQPYDWDVVHFEYDPRSDKHRNRPAGGGASKPTPAPDPIIEEEEEMVYTIRKTKNTGENASKYPIRYALSEASSGYWEEATDSHAGNMNALATAYGTPDAIEQSESAFRVARDAHAAVRAGK